MANVTLFVPDDLKKRMESRRDVKWSNAVRTAIEQKLDGFEEADRLASKSRLSEEDVRRLSEEVDDSMGRHARKLLAKT